MKQRQVVALCILMSIILMGLPAGMRIGIDIDRRWLHEALRDAYGRFVVRENWQDMPHLLPGTNYGWLKHGGALLRIGHALGASSTALENKLDAIPVARRNGIGVLEVDMWLARDGSVRCHHGPDEPGRLQADTCTFDRLLEATRAGHEYLMLDIKTDFKRTANALLALMQPNDRSRVIFQLYSPADLHAFMHFPHVEDFAGPVVTAYVSRSSLNTLIEGAHRAGIKAFTFPWDRRDALNVAVKDMSLLVHPVHDCVTVKAAEKNGYAGIYTLSDLKCS